MKRKERGKRALVHAPMIRYGYFWLQRHRVRKNDEKYKSV
jgi:hypothetical protein